MKRIIRSSQDIEDTSYGFYFTYGNHGFFYETDLQNITDKVVRKFIHAVCDLRGVSDTIRQKALYDKPTLNDFRRRIDKATLAHILKPTVEYYSISGNGFTVNFPIEDFENEIILIH